MEYRAVGNRCTVDLQALNISLPDDKVLAILERKGFKVIDVDIIALARKCIGTSRYRRGAKPSEAPAIVDCSSLVKWLYGQRGIWLPRRSIQQREFGLSVPIEEIGAGDVVFVSGWIDYYKGDPRDGVGHVGIATGEGAIIHAANGTSNVVESPFNSFIGKTEFRGARRYVPKDRTNHVFETPTDREIETADDFRWIVLQSLPRT